jgi:hypothetical protein
MLKNIAEFYFIPAGKPDGLDDLRVYPHGFCTQPAPGTVSADTGTGYDVTIVNTAYIKYMIEVRQKPTTAGHKNNRCIASFPAQFPSNLCPILLHRHLLLPRTSNITAVSFCQLPQIHPASCIEVVCQLAEK